MSWGTSLVRRDASETLGSFTDIRGVIESAFPEAVFSVEPGGAEKVARAAEIGVHFPEVLREHLMSRPAQTVAEIGDEHGGIRFSLGWRDPVRSLGVEAWGACDALMQRLDRMCADAGWRPRD